MPIEEKAKTLTYEDCESEFTKIPLPQLTETEEFIKGNHWQERNGWIGWKPESASTSALNTWIFLETSFVSTNVIGGMVKRLVGATLGKEPDWSLAAKEESQITSLKTKLDERNASLSDWWDNQGVHKQSKKFIHNRAAYGKTCLRVNIPKGYLVESADSKFRLNVSNFDEALSKIYITAHSYANFIDGMDDNYGEKYIIIKLEGDKTIENTNPDAVFEIYYVNKDKKTVIRTLKKGEKNSTDFEIDLGGKNLAYVIGEYEEAIISPTVKQKQKAVNTAKTGENYASNNINFPETTFIDVELPTESVLQPNGKTEKVSVLKSGLGVFRKLFSTKYQTADGGEAIASGQMIQRIGANPQLFAMVAENNKRDMFQEANMLFTYLADSEYASGDSKIASMTDYIILLTDFETEAATMGGWLIETVTRLALRFSNETDFADKFSVIFSPKVTIGKLSVEERRLMLDEIKEFVRSRRNYRVNAEVTADPDKEEITIQKEQKERPNVVTGNGTNPVPTNGNAPARAMA